MHRSSSRRYLVGGLLAALFTLLIAVVRVPASGADPAMTPSPAVYATPDDTANDEASDVPTLTSAPHAAPANEVTAIATIAEPPTATPTDIVVSAASPTAPAPTEFVPAPSDNDAVAPSPVGPANVASNRIPTPTPRAPGTPMRVGLQVGHWKSNELPDDLARLRTSTGAFSNGLSEMNVNLDIAQRVAKLLESVGIVVDVLPATVPVSYDADAFVAIHADGVERSGPRGFKLATPWRFSKASLHLLGTITQEYAHATGMPQDTSITFNMRGYYAFQWRRHQNAVARTTPSVIIETGFITNPTDRAILTKQQDTVAVGIANGIIRYLNERDPNDGAALLTPDFAVQRAISPDGVAIRASPRDDARLLLRAAPDKQIVPLYELDGWYQVVVPGQWRQIGWVRKDQVQQSNAPTPTPLPATDS